ncbi:hypothetical protein MAR_008670 [Mya arenaria]|uniref:Uncharacterized protein n=1 Tax=Mya arenaria TaxID=6604 RepID=A0ABY7DZS7_MYAAR|nr:hypothetical protein MAR_008670 [Mya arenaria]
MGKFAATTEALKEISVCDAGITRRSPRSSTYLVYLLEDSEYMRTPVGHQSEETHLSEYLWQQTTLYQQQTLKSRFVQEISNASLNPVDFEAFRTWHIEDASGVKLGKECADYVNHERDVALTMPSIYTIVSMIPCAKENFDPNNHGSDKYETMLNNAAAQGHIDKSQALKVYMNSMIGEVEFFNKAFRTWHVEDASGVKLGIESAAYVYPERNVALTMASICTIVFISQTSVCDAGITKTCPRSATFLVYLLDDSEYMRAPVGYQSEETPFSEYLWQQTTLYQQQSLKSHFVQEISKASLNPVDFEAFRTWHIGDASGVKLGKECADYVNHERNVALTMPSIYTIVSMIPCAKLENFDPNNHGSDKYETMINNAAAQGHIDKSQALKVRCDRHSRPEDTYYEDAFRTWHIEYVSGVKLGKNCADYVNHEHDTALTKPSIVYMMPCATLWPWLRKQIKGRYN